MNIGFVSIFNESDHKAWSGLIKSMYDNIKILYPNTKSIHGLQIKNSFKFNFKKKINKLLFNKYIEIFRDDEVLKDFAIQIDEFILKNNIDLIFSPGSYHLAFLKSDVKIIIYIDATFKNLIDSSHWYKNYSNEEINSIINTETKIFENCSKIICATKWAEESLLNFYKIQQSKIKVIPFGANISDTKNFSIDEFSLSQYKKFNEVNLIFIGVDYNRKGLEKVLQTLLVINNEFKINCNLSIIGCKPKIEFKYKNYVTVYGFLDKKDETQFAFFEKLMLESHFLFMPSISEAFGLVYAEASYYGVPSIGHKIDGVQYVIKDGVNGYTLPKNSTPNDFAELILDNFNEKKYKTLAENTRKEYVENLNWKNSFIKVKELLESIE